jgi:tRNA(His) 5'-end guanylyltransferase
VSDKTALGDRMKWYEGRYTEQTFMPFCPVIARLDGRAFHTFTHDLERPFDKRFSDLMIETTKFLVKEAVAACGYTQSDEISLTWLTEDWTSEIFFGGKLQKMNSVLASLATAFFNTKLKAYLPNKAEAIAEDATKCPVFDCRAFQVPTVSEAVNCFIWREMDATRNSVQMAVRSLYSHKDCDMKKTHDLMDMLFHKGVNWDDYPAFFKRGTYVRHRVVDRAFAKEELEALPPKHAVRQNPDLRIRRTVVMQENFPPLARISNRINVILHGADPITIAEKIFKDVDDEDQVTSASAV